jgi:hypothetical protein
MITGNEVTVTGDNLMINKLYFIKFIKLIIAQTRVDFNRDGVLCYLNLKTGQFKAEKWTAKE